MFLSIPATHWLFGLMTRYRDDSNYHYVTLRNCNTLEIKAGGISGAGFAIKCAGLIAGTTYSTRPNGTFVSAPRFGWGGLATLLPTLGGTEGNAVAINQLSQVVGWTFASGDLAQRAVIWDARRSLTWVPTITAC